MKIKTAVIEEFKYVAKKMTLVKTLIDAWLWLQRKSVHYYLSSAFYDWIGRRPFGKVRSLPRIRIAIF